MVEVSFRRWLEKDNSLDEGVGTFLRNAGVAALMGVGGMMPSYAQAQTAQPVQGVQRSQDQEISKGKNVTLGEWRLVKSSRGYVVIFPAEKATSNHQDPQVRRRIELAKRHAIEMMCTQIFMNATHSNMQGVQHGMSVRGEWAGYYFIPGQ